MPPNSSLHLSIMRTLHFYFPFYSYITFSLFLSFERFHLHSRKVPQSFSVKVSTLTWMPLTQALKFCCCDFICHLFHSCVPKMLLHLIFFSISLSLPLGDFHLCLIKLYWFFTNEDQEIVYILFWRLRKLSPRSCSSSGVWWCFYFLVWDSFLCPPFFSIMSFNVSCLHWIHCSVFLELCLRYTNG